MKLWAYSFAMTVLVLFGETSFALQEKQPDPLSWKERVVKLLEACPEATPELIDIVRKGPELTYRHLNGTEFIINNGLPVTWLVPKLLRRNLYSSDASVSKPFSEDSLFPKQKKTFDHVMSIFNGWHWDFSVGLSPYRLGHPGKQITLEFISSMDHNLEIEIVRNMSSEGTRTPELIGSLEFSILLDLVQTEADKEMVLAFVDTEYDDGYHHFKTETFIKELTAALLLKTDDERRAITQIAKIARERRVYWEDSIIWDAIALFKITRTTDPKAAKYIAKFETTLDWLFTEPEVIKYVKDRQDQGMEAEDLASEFQDKYFPWIKIDFQSENGKYLRYSNLESYFRKTIESRLK